MIGNLPFDNYDSVSTCWSNSSRETCHERLSNRVAGLGKRKRCPSLCLGTDRAVRFLSGTSKVASTINFRLSALTVFGNSRSARWHL